MLTLKIIGSSMLLVNSVPKRAEIPYLGGLMVHMPKSGTVTKRALVLTAAIKVITRNPLGSRHVHEL